MKTSFHRLCTLALYSSSALLALLSVGAVPMEAQTAPSFTNLYNFTGGSDGGLPNGPLALGRDGNLYGTTGTDGTSSGTVFRVTSAGQLTTLYASFGTGAGSNPAALVAGLDGNFYGTTTAAYTETVGTIFQITPAGTFALLERFPYPGDRGTPVSLAAGNDGNLYGTTSKHNALGGNGTVFQISPTAGQGATILYRFTGGTDGSDPLAALLQGSDGNFYGTTAGGGSNDDGTVFEITPQGALTTLHQFSDGTDGHGPNAKLVQALDGSFYGTAPTGGANGRGTVFKVTAAGQFTTLYAFTGGGDGQTPAAGLILASDGNFYGTTATGGAGGGGTIYQLTPAGTFTTVYSFADTNAALGALVETSDGTLYGTTRAGGNNGQGSIYKLSLPLPPKFFTGQVALGDGVYYLAFSNNGNIFGYYSFLSDPRYIYHFDLGYEYVFDAGDGQSGVYFYDFSSKTYFYTSPSFPFPYLYDFSLDSVLYYYPNSNNPGRYNTDGLRYFYNFSTGQIITK